MMVREYLLQKLFMAYFIDAAVPNQFNLILDLPNELLFRNVQNVNTQTFRGH